MVIMQVGQTNGRFCVLVVRQQTFCIPEGFRAPRGVRKSGKTEPATPGLSYGEFATGATPWESLSQSIQVRLWNWNGFL